MTNTTNNAAGKATASATDNGPTSGPTSGPTEKLRDEEKSDAGELVPGDTGIPGAQKPEDNPIKNEEGLNTE